MDARVDSHQSVLVWATQASKQIQKSQGHTSKSPLDNAVFVELSEDDVEPPPQLSVLGRSVLCEGKDSPKTQTRPTKLRISRNSPPLNTPPREEPAAAAFSKSVRSVGLGGAPVRKARKTPPHEGESRYLREKNIQESARNNGNGCTDARSCPDPNIGARLEGVELGSIRADADIKLSSEKLSGTIQRPVALLPPPPKMTVVETATAAAGSQMAKQKRKRTHFTVNGKNYAQLGGRLGRGGSSDVYRVMGEDSQVFALKRVKLTGVDENTVMGYKGEIELLKRLYNEKRVVRLVDYQINEEKQCLLMVMELGESDLSQILRTKMEADQDAKLDIPFTRYYWQEMLHCLAAVHAHDIVHSDLKPANFLLVNGHLKLIDFGIANAIDIEHTINIHRESHVGTIDFMSPESLQDTSATERHESGAFNGDDKIGLGKLMKLGKPSDVWSLGCILYKMVYGRPPFGHITKTVQRILAIINPLTRIEFPTIGVGGVGVPPELRSTLRACLNRSPSARPTIQDLLAKDNTWLHPENNDDLLISQDLLGQIVGNITKRFRDESRPEPTEAEVKTYAPAFYAKIREWTETA